MKIIIKKFICLILCIISLFGLTVVSGCGDDSLYVKFVENGETVVSLKVKSGECVEKVAEPTQKESGYVYEWNFDFDKPVTESVIVEPIRYTDGVVFDVDDKRGICEVTKYGGKSSAVYVPDNYKGYPVTKIGKSAFSAISHVRTVRLPETLLTIGERAFYHCDGLTSIDIPSSVTKIESYAFDNCSLIKKIVLPKGLNVITKKSFSNTSITEIVIPEGVEVLETDAIAGVITITYAVLPKSLKEMQEGCFWSRGTLKEFFYCGTADEWDLIDIHDTIQSIVDSATVYYYSAEQPTEEGNYWRYVGKNIMKW